VLREKVAAARLAPIAILLVSAFTLLWRIDGAVLWRDEATTSVWARAMVEHRTLVPRVFYDGQLMAQSPDGHDFNDGLVASMQGWLQFYVAAASFWIFGAGTLAARLPFVLAGAVSLWLLYRAAREVTGSPLAALAAPLLGSTSIYFLTAARQARYYALVVLFTCLILVELARYLNDPRRARSWGMHLRLALWGLGTYLANYVSFGGLWLALGLWVLLRRDRDLLWRFAAVSAAMAVPIGWEFAAVHQQFVAGSPAAQRANWPQYLDAIDYHWTELFRLIPLGAIAPAAWFLSRRQGGRPGMAALLASIIVVSPVATVAAGPLVAISRYYFQIVPALVLLAAILAARLWTLAGRGWSVAFFLFALVWPNLNFYHGWCVHAAERQLTRDTADSSIVEFLRANAGPGETVAFHRNVQGMMAYFSLPQLRWVALLDSDEPRLRPLRGKLPDSMFDDWEGVDWYVVWDNRGNMPKKLTPDYGLVWEHRYVEPQSWWDRKLPDRVLGYRVYRRTRKQS